MTRDSKRWLDIFVTQALVRAAEAPGLYGPSPAAVEAHFAGVLYGASQIGLCLVDDVRVALRVERGLAGNGGVRWFTDHEPYCGERPEDLRLIARDVCFAIFAAPDLDAWRLRIQRNLGVDIVTALKKDLTDSVFARTQEEYRAASASLLLSLCWYSGGSVEVDLRFSLSQLAAPVNPSAWGDDDTRERVAAVLAGVRRVVERLFFVKKR